MTQRSYRLAEIESLTGLSARAVRYYVYRGLLPGPEQRGVATVYTHEQLVRLRATILLRKRDHLRLHRVKQRLDAMTPAEMEALVGPLPGAPAAAPAGANAAGESTPVMQPTAPYPCSRWDHVELLPGLELRVRGDAGAIVHRLAQEIFAKYAAAASPGAAPVASAKGPE